VIFQPWREVYPTRASLGLCGGTKASRYWRKKPGRRPTKHAGFRRPSGRLYAIRPSS